MERLKPTIAVDFDDVLSDTNEGLARFHNDRYGTAYGKKDVQHKDLENVWGCTSLEVVDRFHEYLNSPYHWAAPPIEGAQDALRIISERYSPVVITARSPVARTVTGAYLEKNFSGIFKQRDVYLLGARGRSFAMNRSKSEVCKERDASIFIDDSVSHAEEVGAVGIMSLLFDTPWNRSHDTNGSAVRRVHSWSDILTILQARGR